MKHYKLFSLLALFMTSAAGAWAQATITAESADGTTGTFTDAKGQSREGIAVTLTIDGTAIKYAIATSNETTGATVTKDGNAYYTWAAACTKYANGKTDGSYADAKVWRLPTNAELLALNALSDKGWDYTNKGYKWTIGSSTLFLPGAGSYSTTYNEYYYVNSGGYYWSSTPGGTSWENYAYRLMFGDGYCNGGLNGKTNGLCVRLFCQLGEPAVSISDADKVSLTWPQMDNDTHEIGLTYNGASQTPAVTLTLKADNSTLTEGTDYTLSYEQKVGTEWQAVSAGNVVDAGSYRCTVKGVGNYAGSYTQPFTILQKSLADESITIADIPDQEYTGALIIPTVTIKDGDRTLVAGTDYYLSISMNSTYFGTASVTAYGMGNYTSYKETTFKVVAKDVSSQLAIAAIADQTYTGAAIEPTVSVTLDGAAYAAENYTVSYANNVNASTEATITVTINEGGSYKGTASKTFTILPKDIKDVTVEIADQSYTGETITPEATVKDGDVTLAANKDYTLTATNNTEAGTATATITGKGNYKGTVTKSFTIAKATLDGITAAGYNGTYDAAAHTISVTAPEGATISYGTEEGTYTLTEAPAFKDAGTNTVYYKVSKANYEDITGSQTVTIARLEATLAWSDTELTYNGTAQSPTATVSNLAAETDECTVTVEGAQTDAGTYTATATALSNANYKLPEDATVSFTIATNKTALNSAISDAETYYESIRESNPVIAATLLEAINAAKEVQSNNDATQSEIETATTTLNNAVDTAKTDVTTGINAVKAADKTAGWYDMNGRHLTGKPTMKGIYVKDGKKVVIK